jgi:hypothetical protein
MSYIINTKGVELTENLYIDKEGKFLFKIEKFEEDGFSNSGDTRFKLFFKGVEVGTKEPIYSYSEQFLATGKALFKIKQVEVALKAPECYDINDFIGRYIIANIKKETYTKQDGSQGVSYKVKSWEYSQHNDKLAPIPEAKEEINNIVPIVANIPESDIDLSEIPF